MPLTQDSKKILYLPNEPGGRQQAGPRAAFKDLRRNGEIDDYRVAPLSGSSSASGRRLVVDGILNEVREFQPNVILVQHPSGTGIRLTDWSNIRKAAPNALLVYQELDPYVALRQPLPKESRALAQAADRTYTCGTGGFVATLRKAGARSIHYSPHVYDPTRFGRLTYSPSRRSSVVMIANAQRPRKPWRKLPGASCRISLGNQSARLFGDRLSIYGSGWRNSAARGRCDYQDQERILNEATVSINWDHFHDEPHYFSDRWPISLVGGAVHITSWHPGYEDIVTGRTEIQTARTVDEMLGKIDNLLSLSPKEVAELSAAARDFASSRFQQVNETRRLLYECGILDSIPEQSRWIYASGLNRELSERPTEEAAPPFYPTEGAN